MTSGMLFFVTFALSCIAIGVAMIMHMIIAGRRGG